MIRITYDKFDKILEKIHDMDYQCKDEGTYWPSIDDLKNKFKVRTKTDIEFLQWLLDTNGPPETEEEIQSQKYIRKLLYNNLTLVDDED